jgi:hypothetical protein
MSTLILIIILIFVIMTFPVAFPVAAAIIPFFAAGTRLVPTPRIAALVLSRLSFIFIWAAATGVVVAVAFPVAFSGRSTVFFLFTFISSGYATAVGVWFVVVSARATVT